MLCSRVIRIHAQTKIAPCLRPSGYTQMVNVGIKVCLRRKQRTTRLGLRRLYTMEPPSFKLSGKRDPLYASGSGCRAAGVVEIKPSLAAKADPESPAMIATKCDQLPVQLSKYSQLLRSFCIRDWGRRGVPQARTSQYSSEDRSLRFRLLIATVVVATSTLAAHADTFTYTYTGHDFNNTNTPVIPPYTTSDFVSGSFTLAAPLAPNLFYTNDDVHPLSFSFTDGVQTIDNVTANGEQFLIGTDSTGAINTWDIFVGQNGKSIATLLDNHGVGQDRGNNLVGSGRNASDPGTWVETVNSSATPEPSTLALLGTGILGLAAVARRKLS
jgi:hypothetical protein